MRPKLASGWSVATKPYRPRATTPAPAHTQPRCSRTPCQMSQAPPISARAASTKSAMERATVTGLIVAPARAASGGASEVAGRAPLLVAAQDAELVALGVAHDDPATAVLGAAVLDDGGSERLDPSDLLVARTVGRAEVQVDAVAHLLGVLDLDEEQPVGLVGREDHALLVAGQVRVGRVLVVAEQVGPPDGLGVGVEGVDGRVRERESHVDTSC